MEVNKWDTFLIVRETRYSIIYKEFLIVIFLRKAFTNQIDSVVSKVSLQNNYTEINQGITLKRIDKFYKQA